MEGVNKGETSIVIVVVVVEVIYTRFFLFFVLCFVFRVLDRRAHV